MKIEINSKASEVVQALREKYSDRGIKKAQWDSVISDVICAVSPQKWNDFLESYTPDDYYLKLAMTDTKLVAEIAQMVRKSKSTLKKNGAGVEVKDTTKKINT
jgi:hypothetical protein